MKPRFMAASAAVALSISLLGVGDTARAEPGGNPPQAPVLTSSLKLNDAVVPLRKYMTQPGFGAFVLDQEAITLTVYWQGPVPPDLQSSEGTLASGVKIRIMPSAFSKQQMAQQVDTIAAQSVALDLPVLSVGPTPDVAQIEVELDGSRVTPGSDAAAKLQDLVRAMVPAEIGFSYGVGPYRDRVRQDDYDPWQGGGGYFNPSRDVYCSIGFAVLTPGGYGRLLSAAHCAPNGNAALEDGHHDRLSNGNDAVDVRPDEDSLLIDPVGGTIGKVFGGAFNAPTTANRYQFHIGGAGAASVGEDLCVSGANTGEHCNARVHRADIRFRCNSAEYMCRGFRARSTNGNLIGGSGDSGGPVYIERSDGRVGARGIYVNGVPEYFLDCNNIGRFPPGDDGCDRRINVVAIDRLEKMWNVIVEFD